MINKQTIHPDLFKGEIGTRDVFVWGARHDGYAASLVLKRTGIPMAGFIDSSKSLQGTRALGYSILLPDEFFSRYSNKDAFILIASGFYADEIAQRCTREGFQELKDFRWYGELRRFNYQIDVSGSCNLKCISCPRGNFTEHRKPGFMKPDTYEKVICKILKEDPYTGIITLYNWGEPMLNPFLPQIVQLTNQYSLLSAISTNLSFSIDFEPVVKAKPTWIRVSNSGWKHNYEITHTGGNWDLFYENLFKLKEYREKHHPELIVELFFHIYEHNRDDFDKMETLCQQLGFTIRYRHAALAPLDNIAKVQAGEPVSEAVEKTRKLQFLKVEEALELAQSPEEKTRPCYYEDHLWIDWDLSVAHCMEWYRPGLHLVEKDFLSVSLDELVAARNKSKFCPWCKSKGIHRVFSVYGDEKLIAAKRSVGSLP